MYVFGIFALFALGVMALGMLGERFLFAKLPEAGSLIAIGLGVGLAWLADFNLWALWGLPVRAEWIGITLTGAMLGGSALLLHAILGFFASIYRKVSDEAAVLEHTPPDVRRAA